MNRNEAIKLGAMVVGGITLAVWKPAVVAAILLFGVLVALHEAGHLICAKFGGMKVDIFSIGLGPALWTLQRGETEYRIAPIPFGGFVHIVGMDPEEEGAEEDPRSFINRPLWARGLAILGGPLANYVTAIVLLAAVALFSGGGWAVGVAGVSEGGAAARAGLQTGDKILAIDGHPTHSVRDLASRGGGAGTFTLTLQRSLTVDKPTPAGDFPGRRGEDQLTSIGGAEDSAMLRPGTTYSMVFDRQLVKEAGLFGVGVTQALVDEQEAGLGEALGAALIIPWDTSVGMLQGLGRAISGGQGGALGGPVAIIQQATQQADAGLLAYLLFAVTLSIVLGLFNLLPIPALDGGRLVFVVWEAVVPKLMPSASLQNKIHGYGFNALLVLILVLTVGDVRKLVGGEPKAESQTVSAPAAPAPPTP
jgi:regulator of sigma E protease